MEEKFSACFNKPERSVGLESVECVIPNG